MDRVWSGRDAEALYGLAIWIAPFWALRNDAKATRRPCADLTSILDITCLCAAR
jgi:hypothetical protein